MAPTRSLPESWPPTLGDPGIEAGQKIPEVLPQDVCVMSSDDRPVRPFLRTADHYLADDNAPIAELDYPSANLYYNFFWALRWVNVPIPRSDGRCRRRHGYRYIRVKGVAPEGWGATWGKVKRPSRRLKSRAERDLAGRSDPLSGQAVQVDRLF